MNVDNARVILRWSNGETVELGTLEITTSGKTKARTRIRFFRQRLGWELVRKGFWLMFLRRKWEAHR